jgi:hypothetical protein
MDRAQYKRLIKNHGASKIDHVTSQRETTGLPKVGSCTLARMFIPIHHRYHVEEVGISSQSGTIYST